MKRYFTLLIAILFTCTVVAQDQTVGLLSYYEADAYQGYTLIYPHNQPNTYLINNCGEIVHTWKGEADSRPGNTAYLLDDGRLVRTSRPAGSTSDPIWAGGGGANIEILSWGGEQLWKYTLNNENQRLHHDIEVLNDGKSILAIAWEKKTEEEAIEAGRNPETMTQGELWPDYVFEIDVESKEIIWEWHAWDHLVQEFDEVRDNFGKISENPRKISLNYDTNDGKADWLHSNSLDYNPKLDQIMISVPQFDEIWVIDHSTTTEQAAGSTGGKSNHGGDIIYRVGNPRAYNNGTEEDQILHYQHDAHWILDIPENNPLHGLVAVFNNRVGDNYSSSAVFETPWMDYITDYQMFGNTWPPYDLDLTYEHPKKENMYSTGLSSIQILPNGNTLLCSGRQGYIFELNTVGDIVWEYVTPIRAGNAVEQGTSLELNNNLTFRATKYAEDHPAFKEKDLSPKGYIELNPNEEFCDIALDNNEVLTTNTKLSPNPVNDILQVQWDTGMMIKLKIFNAQGQLLKTESANGGLTYLDVSDLIPGIYLLNIDNQEVKRFVVSR